MSDSREYVLAVNLNEFGKVFKLTKTCEICYEKVLKIAYFVRTYKKFKESCIYFLTSLQNML